MRILVTVVLVGAIGCGGGGSGSGGNMDTTPCKVTAAGAVSGMYNCSSIIASWTQSPGIGSVGLSFLDVAPFSSLGMVMGRSGDLVVGTYTEKDRGAYGASTAQQNGNPPPVWVQTVGQGTVAQGTFTMTLTAVVPSFTSMDGTVKSYTVHGAADVTLPPQSGSGATADLLLHASF